MADKTAPKVVYAVEACSIEGVGYPLLLGQTLPADHPAVAENPDLFGSKADADAAYNALHFPDEPEGEE